MKNSLSVDSFLIFQATSSDPVEFWIDWIPKIDEDLHKLPACIRVGEDLVIEEASISSRRLKNIDEDVWLAIEKSGGKILICGPSGVLATHLFRIG